jgi:myo-inositol-1(or 4)-monophosphatase
MLELLEQLFRQVRNYAQSERLDRERVFLQSPRHTTMQFDRDAEDIIIKGLIDSGHGFEVITEERATFSTVEKPDYRIIIDPIDGSDNVARGIMTAAISLAVLPIDAQVVPEQVQWALVGELFSGTVYQSQRGGGAFRNGRRCQVSHVTDIEQSILGINLDSRDISTLDALFSHKPTPAHVRRTGSTAIDVVYIASGAYDAYIDIGDVLTGESFLASASIVLEAGGQISDQYGKPLRPIPNLTAGYSIVVASTKKLHAAYTNKIRVH